MLRTAEIAGRIRERLLLEPREVPGAWQARSNEEVKSVLGALFQELRRYNQERSRSTALVSLPSLEELRSPGNQDLAEWLAFAEAQAEALDLPFFDLAGELANLPAHEVSKLFLDGYHLTEAGHALVARRLLEDCAPIPAPARASRQDRRNRRRLPRAMKRVHFWLLAAALLLIAGALRFHALEPILARPWARSS
jgi:hypothetical protein